MGDLMGALKAEGKEITESPVSSRALGELVKLIAAGEISGKLAKEIFAKMLATGEAPSAIMEREGLRQISDSSELQKVVEQVLAANLKQVDQYRGGKKSVLGFFVGQVMKASGGKANPAQVNELLRKMLAG
jgi:aspartyl-tRNA(Asn)/glutamyl-tRNA(Gln) amidotransferase subunit B